MTTDTPTDQPLLNKAESALKRNGFERVAAEQDSVDDLGVTHLIMRCRPTDELFSLRAKEYRYKGRASFGLEQVEQAASRDEMLLSFIGDDEAFFVFDPEYVLDRGRVYTQPSKHSVSREWIEVRGAAGCSLKRYVQGEEEPANLAGVNTELAAYQ